MSNFALLALALFVLAKSADYALRYASRLASAWRVSEYVVGFLLVAFISVLPETFISINAAWQGTPAFGLGTLFGSNVADLALVFAIVTFASKGGVKIESKIIKNNLFYILTLAIPLLFGLDGYYSRLEGASLVILGILFYLFILKRGQQTEPASRKKFSWTALLLLVFSLAGLLAAAHFAVQFGVALAQNLGVNPVLIAMLFVGLGTTLPELLFSIKAVRSREDGLALGDILGTVITDATIVVGILAIISPFAFPARIVYVTGIFMLAAAVLLLYLMKTGRRLTKKESWALLGFYLLFVLIELAVAKIF